jgi:5'-3' exonuclease
MGNTKWSNNGQCNLVNINHVKNKNWKQSINLNMLKDIFYHLSKSEEYFFKNVYSVYKNKNKKIYKDTYNFDTINTNEKSQVFFYIDDKIKYNEVGYKTRYYKFYNIINVDDACEQYLTGLYWVLGYYNNHNHDNWSWYYSYHGSPFISDLYKFLVNKGDKYLRQINLCKDLQPSKQNTTLEQLFMVLPKSSLMEIIKEKDNIMFEKLLRIFNTDSKILNEYYPDKIYLEMINKEYVWQSKVFLKSFDNTIFRLIQFLD